MTPIEKRICETCREEFFVNCFRKGDKACVWCTWSSVSKRAAYRYRDLLKRAKDKLQITKTEFIAWYEREPDCCAYCGLGFTELKRLRLKRLRGVNCVGWDIDRIHPN